MIQNEEADVAILLALDELQRWPDLPCILFGAKIDRNGKVEEWAIEPSQLRGVFAALRRHVETLRPYAREVIWKAHGYDRDNRRALQAIPPEEEL